MATNRTKYPKFKNGAMIRIDLGRTVISDACCDCGLVHIWRFHHIKGNIWELGWFRDSRATGQLRRHNYGFLQQDGKYKSIF